MFVTKKKKMNLQSVPQSGENTGSKSPIRYHRKLIFTEIKSKQKPEFYSIIHKNKKQKHLQTLE